MPMIEHRAQRLLSSRSGSASAQALSSQDGGPSEIQKILSQWVSLCAGIVINRGPVPAECAAVVAVGQPLRRHCHAHDRAQDKKDSCPVAVGQPLRRHCHGTSGMSPEAACVVAVGQPLRRHCHQRSIVLRASAALSRSGSASAQALSFARETPVRSRLLVVAVGQPLRRHCHCVQSRITATNSQSRSGSASAQALSSACAAVAGGSAHSRSGSASAQALS